MSASDRVRPIKRHELDVARGVNRTMKKPSKTAAELEASIKVEMEYVCDWPTDMAICVWPDGHSWRARAIQQGWGDGAGRCKLIELIGDPPIIPRQCEMSVGREQRIML